MFEFIMMCLGGIVVFAVIGLCVKQSKKVEDHRNRCRKLINEMRQHLDRGVTDALFVPSETYADLIPDEVSVYAFYWAWEVENRSIVQGAEPEGIIARVQRAALEAEDFGKQFDASIA